MPRGRGVSGPVAGYRTVQISAFRGFSKDPWPSPVCLQELLGEVGQPAGVVVKMRRCRAIKIRQDLHVKEEFLRGWRDWPRRLKGLLGRGRLRRQWSASLLARERGVPTPEPLAYLEERQGLLPSRSLLVTRYESEFCTLSHYLKGKGREPSWSRDRGERFLRELARAVWGMHDLGMVHLDLKGSNILVREDKEGWSFRFTDLKASRFRNGGRAKALTSARGVKRDMVRLLTALHCFFSEEERRAFLDSYLSSGPKQAQRLMARWEAEAVNPSDRGRM
ncbi:MAG: lipopolysaccharide kinase InaA family protein [candidate division NC10 bacterium]|nr:lipopolysaccharide kinase InaA family protein [candidate division NC10 bacterium]